MAALLLADHVVTMMPAPLADFGQTELHAAVRASPRYMRFIESWAWSLPLWRDGVIASSWRGDDPTRDVRAACAAIDEVPEFGPLRPLMRRSLFEDQREYLDSLAADLLKGGPDPGISVPMAAGLDRFAARHGFMVARSEPVSVAQRAEARHASPGTAVAVPILVRAGGERVLRAREILEPELRELRAAWQRLAGEGSESVLNDAASENELRSCIRAYSEAFEVNRALLCETSRDEERVVDGWVTLRFSFMPFDAVLRASLDAVRVMGSVVGMGSCSGDGGPASPSLPVLRDALAGKGFMSIVVKVMGRAR